MNEWNCEEKNESERERENGSVILIHFKKKIPQIRKKKKIIDLKCFKLSVVIFWETDFIR